MDEDFEENFSVIYEKARADWWDSNLKPIMIIFAKHSKACERKCTKDFEILCLC